MEAIARKELSREEHDGKETIVNEIKHFVFNETILHQIDVIFDDWETAQYQGVFKDNEDEINYIEVDDCVEYLQKAINEKGEICIEKDILDYLQAYKGFTIWV